MDDYELLLRHTEAWAKDKKRPLDRDLLETAISLRSFHDVKEAQEWPTGSVEHLMLVRWPSHGPAEEPDVPTLIETLDTFWRFLRSTGRMRSGSAEPKDLLKEAKRAGAGMREACADTDRHSTSKSLMRFAAESGLSLDDAGSEEEINARLQQVMEAFNDLPFEERAKWLPDPGTRGSVPAQRMTDLVNQVLGENPYEGDFDDEDEFDDDEEWDEEEDFHPETWALIPEPGDIVTQPKTSVSAQEAQASPFVQQCLALARWVGDGKPVTAMGVLKLAPAREAYVELGLWDRELRSRERRPYSAPLETELSPEESDALRDAALTSLRSAGDAEPLDRLWESCQLAGLIEVGRTKATATVGADPRHTSTDDDWLKLGVSSIMSLVFGIEWPALDPLLRVLLPFLQRGVDRVTEDEVREWWWTHPANRLAGLPAEDEPHVRPISDQQAGIVLWHLEDTGVWRREGETLHRTALGTEVAAMLVGLMDQGLLMP